MGGCEFKATSWKVEEKSRKDRARVRERKISANSKVVFKQLCSLWIQLRLDLSSIKV